MTAVQREVLASELSEPADEGEAGLKVAALAPQFVAEAVTSDEDAAQEKVARELRHLHLVTTTPVGGAAGNDGGLNSSDSQDERRDQANADLNEELRTGLRRLSRLIQNPQGSQLRGQRDHRDLNPDAIGKSSDGVDHGAGYKGDSPTNNGADKFWLLIERVIRSCNDHRKSSIFFLYQRISVNRDPVTIRSQVINKKY